MLAASLEDAAAVEERPNMPGTVDQWPNWSLAYSVDEIESMPLPKQSPTRLRRARISKSKLETDPDPIPVT